MPTASTTKAKPAMALHSLHVQAPDLCPSTSQLHDIGWPSQSAVQEGILPQAYQFLRVSNTTWTVFIFQYTELFIFFAHDIFQYKHAWHL